MASFLKNSAGKLLKISSGKLLKAGSALTYSYTLVAGKSDGNIITLPNGDSLFIDYNIYDNGPSLLFSADFDLVITTTGIQGDFQWGSYEICESMCEETIYIYDHNKYENGYIVDDATGLNPFEIITNNYTPIAILHFNPVTEVLTVTH